jgi:hypothetical protein
MSARNVMTVASSDSRRQRTGLTNMTRTPGARLRVTVAREKAQTIRLPWTPLETTGFG